MSALTVLIIRHAEKPDEEWPGPGLSADGQPDKKSLVIRGWQRAGAWAALFGSSSAVDGVPIPTVIYAANPGSGEEEEPSQRPFETIKPLADRLHLAPITRWAQGQESQLAGELLDLTGTALVCWEHKAIAAALLPALLGTQNLPGVPSTWDGKRFDVVLRLDRSVPGVPWSFRQQFPRLLAGDTEIPL
jgi:hypothetical protein